jgi:hypothetical protein
MSAASFSVNLGVVFENSKTAKAGRFDPRIKCWSRRMRHRYFGGGAQGKLRVSAGLSSVSVRCLKKTM